MLQVVLLTVLAVLLVPGVAFAQIVELEGRYWFTDVKASVKAKSGSVSGTDIDLEGDLGLESGDAPEARLTFFTGPSSRIRLAYTHLDFDGDKTLKQTVTFQGQTFTSSSRVLTDLEIHYGRVGWLWQPLTIPGILKFGGLLEAKAFVIDASLQTFGSVPEVGESAAFPIALPTLGLALDVTPYPTLHLFAEASGLYAGDYGHIVDAEAGLRFVPIRLFSLSAGYRIFDVRVGGDDFAKLTTFGPFVGASLRF
jgi:hypothetical protein